MGMEGLVYKFNSQDLKCLTSYKSLMKDCDTKYNEKVERMNRKVDTKTFWQNYWKNYKDLEIMASSYFGQSHEDCVAQYLDRADDEFWCYRTQAGLTKEGKTIKELLDLVSRDSITSDTIFWKNVDDRWYKSTDSPKLKLSERRYLMNILLSETGDQSQPELEPEAAETKPAAPIEPAKPVEKWHVGDKVQGFWKGQWLDCVINQVFTEGCHDEIYSIEVRWNDGRVDELFPKDIRRMVSSRRRLAERLNR